MGYPEEALGLWLQTGSAPAIVAAQGVNQWTENFPLCLSSLYSRLSNKKIIEIKINLKKKKDHGRALRGGLVAKSLPCKCQDPIWVLVLILAARLSIHVPACGLGKQSRIAQSHGTLHPCGRAEEAPGFWLWIGA